MTHALFKTNEVSSTLLYIKALYYENQHCFYKKIKYVIIIIII